jgi:hypothetical protein
MITMNSRVSTYNDILWNMTENCYGSFRLGHLLISKIALNRSHGFSPDNFYIMLGDGDDLGKVTLHEVVIASTLLEKGQWEHPNMAANRIYKLMNDTGKDTTGQAGF